MPNDMSPIPPPSTAARLAARTGQYCRRAQALCDDPCLTQVGAAAALDHLAALQGDLARARLGQAATASAELRRIETPFKELETSLARARAALSEALLRAIPDKTNLYGPVPHGVQPDAAINHEKDTTPAPPQAISASRALLDLEALRPYLSDAALRQALERYTKDTNAHDVAGVSYAALPATAYLPCYVY